MILLIDNYDSFVFNLEQALAALGAAPRELGGGAGDDDDAVGVGGLREVEGGGVRVGLGEGHRVEDGAHLEVGGNGAVHFAPDSPDDFARAVMECIATSEVRRPPGATRLWDDCAARWYEALLRASA